MSYNKLRQLQYGDIMMLAFDEHSQTDIRKGLYAKPIDQIKTSTINIALLSTKGFIEDQVQVQTVPLDDTDTSFEVTMKNLHEKGISNLRECLFRILPPVSHDIHDEYCGYLETYKQINKYCQNTKSKLKDDLEIKYLTEKLEFLKKKVKKQNEINQEKMDKAKGNPVLFGDMIMLQHVDSEEYLTISDQNSTGYKVGYNVILTHWISHKSMIKIKSKFKSRQKGEVVLNFDDVILEIQKEGYFLDVGNDIPYYLNDYQIDLEKNKFRKDISFLELRSQKYQAIYSNGSNASWKVSIFSKYSTSQNQIQGHDMVRIMHTELGGYLTSALRYRSSAPEVYIRNYIGNQEIEKNCSSSVWEIQNIGSMFVGDTISIEEKKSEENNEQNEADVEVISTPVKFKHFLSEKYLFAVPFKEGYLMVLSNHTMKAKKKNYLKLNLHPVISENKKIVNGSTYLFKSKKYSVVYDPKLVLSRKLLIQKKSEDNQKIFMPLNDHEVDEVNRLCKMAEVEDNQNAYKIIRLSDAERLDILFARSVIPYFMYFISFFSAKRLKMLKPSTYIKMEDTLGKLCCFLFHKPFSKNQNILFLSGKIDQKRQQILRDLNIVDYLTELLSRPFDRGLFDIKLLKQNMPITRILSMSYTTIKFINQKNMFNEIYCSQWLNLFLDQSLKTKGRGGILAELTLTELIVNNKRILTNRINRGTVNKFIQLVSEDKVAKYIDILIAIIICQGKPIQSNQREISQLLLRDEKMRKRLMYKLRMNGKFVEVCFDAEFNNYVSIKNLKRSTGFIELMSVSVYEYFISFTMLLSNLCVKNNYRSIEILQEAIPYDIVYNLVTDESYPVNIRNAFMSLMTHLWIKVAPLQKVNLPNYIKFWENTRNVKRDKAITEKKNQVNNLKCKVIEFVHSFQEYQLYEQEDITYLISNIKLLKNMIQLDVTTNEEIKEIFVSIKSLLGYIVSIFEQLGSGTGHYVSFSQTELLYETSILICSILKLLFTYEIDLKVEEILGQLKTQTEVENDKRDLHKRVFYQSKEQLSLLTATEGDMPEEKMREELLEQFDSIFKKVLDTDYSLVLQKNQEIHYMLMLLAIHTKDGEITRNTMNLVHLMHNQSEMVRESFNDMQLITNKNISEFFQVQAISHKLSELSYTCEKWYTLPNSEQSSQLHELMNTLLKLLTLSKSKPNGTANENDHAKNGQKEDSGIHPIFDNIIESNFVSVIGYHQNFLRNTGVLKHLVKILQWDLIFNQYLSKAATKPLLTQIYKILSFAVQQNQTNKKYLFKYLSEPFLVHFYSDIELGASSFLLHLLSDNEEIIGDTRQINTILEKLLKRLDIVSSKSPLRAFILKIVGNIVEAQSNNGQTFKNFVLNKLFEKKSLAFNLDIDQQTLTNWSDSIQNSEPQVIHNGTKGIILNPELCFYLSYFDLLTTCSMGKNAFAENISQNLVSLDEIYLVLESKNIHPVIKSKVLSFFFEVYLEIDVENYFGLQMILENILKILVDDLGTMLDSQVSSKEEPDQVFIVTHDLCQTQEYYSNQCVYVIIDCLKLIVKSNFKTSSSGTSYSKLKYLVEKGLIYTKKYKEHSNSDIKRNLAALRKTILDHCQNDILKEIQVSKQISIGENDMVQQNMTLQTSKTQELILDGLLQRQSQAQAKHAHSDKASMQFFRKDDLTANIISNFSKEYFESPLFEARKHAEFKRLIKLITHLENQNTTGLNLKPTSFMKFSINLISFLQPSEQSQLKTTTDYINGLLMFRLFIEEGNPGCSKGLASWDVDDWQEHQHEIVSRQNLLLELGLVELILQILNEIDNDELTIECIKLSIGLLIGGNKDAQDRFYKGLSEGYGDSDITGFKKTDMQVLKKLKYILDRSFQEIRTVYEEKNHLRLRLVLFENKAHNSRKYKNKLNKYDEIASLSVGSAQKIYRFLQLLCEGHNETLQNFLRQQFSEKDPLYSTSINFVRDAAISFGSLVKIINLSIVDLLNQIFEFMVEVVQGPCVLNQKVLVECKIIEYCKDLMNEFVTEKDFQIKGFEDDSEEIKDLVKQSVKLMYSLLEANSNHEVYRQIGFNIDFDYLVNLMVKEYKALFEGKGVTEDNLLTWNPENLDPFLKISLFEEDALEAFNIYFLIKTLSLYLANTKKKVSKLEGIQSKAFKFYKYHSGNIQLEFKDANLYDVNFAIHPACRNLDSAYKNEIILGLKRENAQEKIESFFDGMPNIFDTIEQSSKLQGSKGFLSPSNNQFNWVRRLSLGIIMVSNILMFIFFRKKLKFGSSIDDPRFDSTHWVLRGLGIGYVVLEVYLLYLWIVVKSPTILRKSLRGMFIDYYKKIQATEYDGKMPDLKFKEKTIEEVTTKERVQLIQEIERILGNKFSTPRISYFVSVINFFVSDFEFKYFLVNICFALAGIIMRQSYFYTILMLDFVFHFQILRNIVTAISSNSKLLILTACLISLVIFLYTQAGFHYFSEDFFMFDIESGESTCTTMIQCFATVFALGPRSSGSIGDVMIDISYHDNHKYFVRFFYDLLIFITVNIILMNIIFGIILDKFAELRKKKNFIEFDITHYCTICSLNRQIFDKSGQGFDHHIEHEHNVWNYVFFLFGLRKKDKTEYDGMESYVMEKQMTDDGSWIPIERALSVSHSVEDEQKTIDLKLEKLMEELKKFNSEVDNKDKED